MEHILHIVKNNIIYIPNDIYLSENLNEFSNTKSDLSNSIYVSKVKELINISFKKVCQYFLIKNMDDKGIIGRYHLNRKMNIRNGKFFFMKIKKDCLYAIVKKVIDTMTNSNIDQTTFDSYIAYYIKKSFKIQDGQKITPHTQNKSLLRIEHRYGFYYIKLYPVHNSKR